MSLSVADAARLVLLKAARDELIAGKRVAKVASGGRSVDYAPADMSRLDGEIAGLEATEAAGETTVRRRGAFRFRVS